MEFKRFLKARRIKLGLSQREVSEQLALKGQFITPAGVSHWELGRNRAPLESSQFREALASVLQMSVEELVAQLELVVFETKVSQAALVAANIVESLPPDGREIALDQLRMLEKHFLYKRTSLAE